MRPALVLALLALAGCAVWHPLPTDLPFPPRPVLNWTECYSTPQAPEPDMLCLTPADADVFLKYDDKLQAFEHAWQRLSK